jgi:hypothetical protein
MYSPSARLASVPAFPMVRSDLQLCRAIDRLLAQVHRYPLRAEEFFIGSELAPQTIARLLSGAKHRRPAPKRA